MELSEPTTFTVAELREWLLSLPDDAILVVDDAGAGVARDPYALNGPWRLERHPDGSYDYWQDNRESAAEYANAAAEGSKPFDALPTGVLLHPR